MKKVKYLMLIFILVIMGISTNYYLKSSNNLKNVDLLAYEASDFNVLFDANYGSLVGFTEQSGFTEITNGLYGINSTWFLQPYNVEESRKGTEYLQYWSLNPKCTTKDLKLTEDVRVNTHTVYYACYGDTKLDPNDYSVLFDANYGTLVGFETFAGYDKISDGLYGIKSTWASQPINIANSKRGTNSITFWSLDPKCTTNDLAVGVDFKVNSHTVYYACYTETTNSNNSNNNSTNPDDYTVLFDPNYGELAGFKSEGFVSLENGLYGTNSTWFSQPSLVEHSKRGNNYILYWSLDHKCSTKDLLVGADVKVDGRTVYYACYEQTNFANDGIRYAQNGAYASGENVSCGTELHITSCYKNGYGSGRNLGFTEYCSFDKKNGKKANGVVLRNNLATDSSVACVKENYTAYFHEDSYKNNQLIDGDLFECGNTNFYQNGVCSASAEEGGQVNTPDSSRLHYNGKKFIGWAADNDGKNVNCSGNLVTASTIIVTGDVHYYACFEEDEDCENSEKINNGKGLYNVTVCYNVDENLEVTPVSDDYDDLLTCASGYNLDEVSKSSIIETTCTKEGSCYRTFELNCMGERPRVSAPVVMAGEDGYGTINFSASSNAGIKGWYASSYYEKPTINTNWIMDSRGSYTLDSTPGSVFLWAIDNDNNISYATMTSVIDRVTTDTTVKNLDIKTSDGKSLNVESYAFNDVNTGITSSDYVRLSNKVNDDSKILASGFNPFDTAYKVTTTSDKISVYATLTSKDSKYVEGYEPRTVLLDYGVNTVLIKIQNKKGKVRTYTIIVTREDDRDSTNVLKSLKVSEGKVEFDSYTTDYIVSVGKNKKSVTIKATILNENAKFVDGFGPRKIELNDDSTTASIKVSSETGSIRTYTITFVKSGEEVRGNDEALLSSLSLSKAHIAFDKNIYDYNTTVDNEIDSINIYAIAENGGDSITVYKTVNGETNVIESNNIPLNVGANNLTILVATKDGKTRRYSLNIMRKENGLNISSDTSLSMLEVDGYDIDFSSNKYNYVIKIKREKTLVIAATPMSNRAEVYIRGNDNLTAFSTVKIKVVAEDGQFKEYTIDIKKDTVNKTLETIGLISGVIIIICGIIIIRIKRRKNLINDYYAE